MNAYDEYIKGWEYRTEPHQQSIADLGNLYFVFVVAGLIALYFGFTVLAVMLFIIGVWCLGVWLKEQVISGVRTVVMNEQYYLAKFIKEHGTAVGSQLHKELKGLKGDSQSTLVKDGSENKRDCLCGIYERAGSFC